MPPKAKETNRVAVLVTTDKRGVFFGYVDAMPAELPASITLTNARMCTFWSRAMRGVFGLASNGPDNDCKIGRAVPDQVLNGLTSITRCTVKATERWEAGPWKN